MPNQNSTAHVVPTGKLKYLSTDEIKPSTNNPRHLFDRPRLETLKKNIREHGVLVPITVYQPKGQTKFSILDGERRYRCCIELGDEGTQVQLPANIVEPPSVVASLLYMFSIHNFRAPWELMPTALSLKTVMEKLGVTDNRELNRLTGLSDPQIERCKILLTFPEKFQRMSLEADSTARIPSNFWIEAYPVIGLCEAELIDLRRKFDRNGITERLVEKYRAKAITSVTHFRRIMEAFEIHKDDTTEKKKVVDTLRRFIVETKVETRSAFDHFISDNRRVQKVLTACEEFMMTVSKAQVEYTPDEEDRLRLSSALTEVQSYASKLVEKLRVEDAPQETDGERD